MNTLEQARYRVRSFLEPTTNLTWGTKIYAPEDNDPKAHLKREIIAFAERVLQCSENVSGDASFIHFQPDAEAYMRRIELELTKPECSDYSKFMGAIQELISVGKVL